MSFDAVIFDLDGTLSDSAPGLLSSLRHMHDAIGWDVPDDTELITWLGPPAAVMLAERGADEATIARAMAAFREHTEAHGLMRQRVFDGVAPLLSDLRDAGVPTAIATFKIQRDADFVADRFGLRERLRGVHGRADDDGLDSKAPIIARALGEIGVDPSRSVAMIGDREHDVLAARELGLTAVGVTYGYGSAEELTDAGADHVVHSLDELRTILGLAPCAVA